MGKTGIAASGSTDAKNVFRNTKYMDLPAVIPYQIGNEELKWETTMQYDAAVEFALLKGSKIGVCRLVYERYRRIAEYHYAPPSCWYG